MVALAVCVFAETQDQEAAEQYFARYGYYPSWYNYGTYGYAGVRGYPYAGKLSIIHFNYQKKNKIFIFSNFLLILASAYGYAAAAYPAAYGYGKIEINIDFIVI